MEHIQETLFINKTGEKFTPFAEKTILYLQKTPMNLQRFAGIVCFCLCSIALRGQDAGRAIQLRNGLPAFLKKLEEKRPVTISYLGGSITAAAGYRVQVTEWLQQQYPGVNIKAVNAGVGGTGSSLGVFRLQYDVLRFHPDLVFVEFAVNDAGSDSMRICRAMEGIVRQIKKANPATDICFLYTINEPMIRLYSKDSVPGSVRYMESVAAHYQLPSINLAHDVLRLQARDSLVFRGKAGESGTKVLFTQDGTHPGTEGHKVYTATIQRAFGLLRSRTASKQAGLPVAMFADNMENATVYAPSKATVSGNWQPFNTFAALNRFKADYPEGIYTNNLQDSVVIDFKGSYFGVGDVLGPSTCGKLLVTIDGKPRAVTRFDKYCARYRRNYFFIDDLGPGHHRVVIRIDPAIVNKKAIVKPDEIGNDLTIYEPNYFYFGNLLLPE